ncbi:hypothetical protein [Nocardia lasii]|uniref:Uncharacterized protein n=1 Tax=Nocardia lasii TaxID=1616107 RepID=A0ABW1JY33_9NOCA
MAMGDLRYVRFHGVAAGRRGENPGVFGLVNGLWAAGQLSGPQVRFRRAGNDWFDENLANPGAVDPRVYDRERNPEARSWFKSSATTMIERVGGYLAILDAHGIAWERVESDDPGPVLYEDEHQIVVGSGARLREPTAAYGYCTG